MAMQHWWSFWFSIGIPTFTGFAIFMKFEAAIYGCNVKVRVLLKVISLVYCTEYIYLFDSLYFFFLFFLFFSHFLEVKRLVYLLLHQFVG